jgi:hypothetical protein
MTKEVEGMKGEGLAFPSPNAAILAYDYGQVGFQAKDKSHASERRSTRSSADSSLRRPSAGSSSTPSSPATTRTSTTHRQKASQARRRPHRPLRAREDPRDHGPHQELRLPLRDAVGHHLVARRHPHPPEEKGIIDAAQKKSEEIVRHWQDGLLSEEERYRMNLEVWHDAKPKSRSSSQARCPQRLGRGHACARAPAARSPSLPRWPA